ncbi:drug resistance transporter, EmrB/QacA subfamily [Paenibacillus algorifonticola]|uniref:Drug resistance transporter, EmrB/QacA subfamily n=1 Tax=Paenibacillus algorifonticola TaxID=684063 RepID=A0A1I2H224_9BACL|nr:MDR family MFS transporter [Paenibacillus algorifonticola]SFF23588.1 drug resistance transporter, EmrB/QacA subfamily [Paenibacillus algorifonticola]
MSASRKEATGEFSEGSFWPIMTAIFFGAFLSVLAISSINVAIPVLMNHFQAELSTVKWTLTGFMLANGIIAPVTGYLVDKLSAKYLYIWALIGFTVSCALCAVAWSMEALIVFRLLQGLFSGLILPVTMTIIYQVIPRERQAFASSMWSLSTVLAPALGPTLSGWLIQSLSWQWVFWMNLPFGIAAVLAAWKLLPHYRLSEPKRFDSSSFALVITCSSFLLIAFSEIDQWGWGSWKTVGLLAAGMLLLLAFIWRERSAAEPLLDLSVFSNRRFAMCLIVSSVLGMSLYSGSYLTPVFLQTIQNASAMEAGLVMLPASIAMAVFIPIAGKLYGRVGPARLVLTGLLLMGIGTLAMSRLTVDTPHSYVIGWMIVRNIGVALGIVPVSNAGMEQIARQMTAHASSASNWVRQASASLAIGLFTSLLSTRLMVHVAERAPQAPDKDAELQAYTMAINDVTLLAAIIVFAVLPFLWVLRRRKEPATIPSDQALVHK